MHGDTAASEGLGWALVTGASGGIGADIARVLATRGHPLVLTARSEGKLQDLAEELEREHGTRSLVIPMDLGVDGAAAALAESIAGRGVRIEILVNNAGFGQYGDYLERDPADESSMLNVNLVALTALTRRYLPEMVGRGYGRILNVGSTGSFFPGPLISVYYATKAYVMSYSEALAEELRNTGVTVTCLCPGPTRTGFQRRAGVRAASLVKSTVMEPDEVARIGVDAMFAGKRVAVAGIVNKLMVLLPRFLPRAVVPKLVLWVQARRNDQGAA